jgi:hypothetical protein
MVQLEVDMDMPKDLELSVKVGHPSMVIIVPMEVAGRDETVILAEVPVPIEPASEGHFKITSEGLTKAFENIKEQFHGECTIDE